MSQLVPPHGGEEPVSRRRIITGAAAAAAAAGLVARPGAAQAQPSSQDAGAALRTAKAEVAGAQRLPVLRFDAYRHNWGFRRGRWVLTLRHPLINRHSFVYVAISEGGPATRFVGDAPYTVHNIAPFDGGVTIRVNIEWGSPISLIADYLIADVGL